ncbi:alpha/beta fold hydrolase [Aquimarina sp. AU474]|uniref:alpha/beta fold hydrolase n=1 Tax=Aquimarina sp. AU474 TaxID=2108529 RepID=UPI000D6861B8|nr:alpha/beta fold hydrolase [Aquimarina sp. AU474]
MILAHKGIKINYNTFGKGAPVVFLHGFLENSTMWEEAITFFSNQYQCISIDLLGHGNTENLGYVHTMEDMSQAVRVVLDSLKINTATFVGHSMGGYVALAYIDLFADSVSGLVLLNSTSLPDSEERKISRSRAIDIVKKNPNAYTSMAIANLFAEKHRFKFSQQINSIKNQASKTSLQGIISSLEGMKIRKDRGNILQNFKGAKVIFAGKLDPILIYSQSLQEAKQYNIDLVSFDGGHMSYVENKEEFLSELDKFLLASP